MKIILNNRGQRTLQSSRSWQTNNERETTIEFEPIFLKVNNCLHINSTHFCADGKRKKSTFIHVLTLGDIVILRDFLSEVLNIAEYELQINPVQPTQHKVCNGTPQPNADHINRVKQ